MRKRRYDIVAISIRHFESVHKALYELTGLFVNGDLKNHKGDPKVRAAIAALAKVARANMEERDET